MTLLEALVPSLRPRAEAVVSSRFAALGLVALFAKLALDGRHQLRKKDIGLMDFQFLKQELVGREPKEQHLIFAFDGC